MDSLLFPLPEPTPAPKPEKLLALSWKQPYATLMLPPYNKMETRKWQSHYRGRVLICTCLTYFKPHQLLSIAGPDQYARIEALQPDKALRGKAIATARLADCRPMTEADEDACFVQYRAGLWCHIYEDVQPIEPLPWRGGQGWRTVPADFQKLIKPLP